MNIVILGKEFPIEYTIQAQQELAEKFGDSFFSSEGPEVSAESFESAAKSMCDIACMISILMKAGESRERVRCLMYGEDFEGPKALTPEQVSAAMHPKDFVDYQSTILECMKSAQKTTVEIKEEKNVKTTP